MINGYNSQINVTGIEINSEMTSDMGDVDRGRKVVRSVGGEDRRIKVVRSIGLEVATDVPVEDSREGQPWELLRSIIPENLWLGLLGALTIITIFIGLGMLGVLKRVPEIGVWVIITVVAGVVGAIYMYVCRYWSFNYIHREILSGFLVSRDEERTHRLIVPIEDSREVAVSPTWHGDLLEMFQVRDPNDSLVMPNTSSKGKKF